MKNDFTVGQDKKDTVSIGPFELECGEILPEVTLAYEKVGRIGSDQVILVCHALTGDAHAVGDEWIRDGGTD